MMIYHQWNIGVKSSKEKKHPYKPGNQNSARTLQELSDHISDLQNTLDSCSLSCEQEKRHMAELHQKKMNLEALVNDFQDNNEEYFKVIKSVGEEVLGVISNVKVLLRYALLSITESITNNPERFTSLFYNMLPSIIDCYNSDGQDYTASYMYGGRIQQQSQQTHHQTIIRKLIWL